MNRHLCLALAGLSLVAAFPACSDRDNAPPGGFNQGSRTRTTTTTTTTPQPTPPPRETTVTPPRDVPPPPSTPVPQTPVDYPYATPVAGKPGFVTSPYAPEAGLVDVRGMSPGQQARDPYTNKIFLVP